MWRCQGTESSGQDARNGGGDGGVGGSGVPSKQQPF